MIGSYEASYQQFGDDCEDTPPQESGVLIHVVPELGKAEKWAHMVDLDAFFTRVYQYHQRHGFKCMAVQEVFEVFQFVFVVVFTIGLLKCVDYSILFRDKAVNGTKTKVTIADAILPSDECIANLEVFEWTVLTVGLLVLMLRVVKTTYNLYKYHDVRNFYNTALNIKDSDLENVTWHEVQKRLLDVQKEQLICIHKTELTELDIYHRILRFKNYMVAMINKSLIPPKFHLPLVGEVIYFSHGFKFNLEMILYWGPSSPFQESFRLKDDYKKIAKRKELAAHLSRHISYVAIGNFLLCPLILLWQILYAFFNYAEVVKREPSTLGARCWSLYAKYYLRHFNELDHELNARLNRAYRPASKYMSIFTSPLMTIIAKNIVFIAGALLAVLLSLSVYDEDVLTVEHVLTMITALGALIAIFRVLIPDENLVWWPEHLMNSVLAHVHYLPSHWRGNAHTQTVRNEFTHLFQYKATFLLMEVLSPIVTPVLLLTHVRPRALEFVDFFRSFTVEVGAVGDVCSFAQMDIRSHGNPDWNPGPSRPTTDQYTQAEEGKTELSLIHFTYTNPEWSPPAPSGGFVSNVKEEAKKILQQDPMLFSSSTGGNGLSTFAPPMALIESILQSQLLNRSVHTNVSRNEGPVYDRNYLHHGEGLTPSLGASVFGADQTPADPNETTAMDMSVNALFLHHAHQRGVERRGGVRQASGPSNIAGGERLPLLGSPSRLS
ncbi:autophagy-related protein 9A isoform X2 [Halyomorpha halys]|uniref:autophagy-related protein 9A isoform X2 n=1 Tax=Halyomorpha halys TaxID=286706 RepID=UPI0006D4F2A2|nr:autophagy-related protein 9A isoform X2 [Halyomorpha halys]